MNPRPRRTAVWGALACAALLCLALRTASATGAEDTAAPQVRIAVFPIENLTGAPAPVKELRAEVMAGLSSRGVQMVDEEALQRFFAKHRVRWAGGIDGDLGRALVEETGASHALVTIFDVYGEGEPPRFGFTMRLVSTETEQVRVAWAAGPALAGNERPGVLDLGLVRDVSVLALRAVDEACGELQTYLAGSGSSPSRAAPRAQRRFRPRVFHAAPEASLAERANLRIAVMPFANESPRSRAGEILAHRFVGALARAGFTNVAEPGDVRRVLIETRLIQKDGLAYAQAELLRDLLDVDLVLTGAVFRLVEPVDYEGYPVVDFTLTAIDTRRRQVGWVAFSRATGRTGVRFFGLKGIRTAGRLSDELIRGVIREAAR